MRDFLGSCLPPCEGCGGPPPTAIPVAPSARLSGRGRSRGSGSAGQRTADVALLSWCSLASVVTATAASNTRYSKVRGNLVCVERRESRVVFQSLARDATQRARVAARASGARCR